jgi:SAM-dependent methyltransferase
LGGEVLVISAELKVIVGGRAIDVQSFVMDVFPGLSFGDDISPGRLTSRIWDVVEFGCGYGTFTIPAAQIVRGVVYTFDNDPAMVSSVRMKAKASSVDNVRPRVRDLIERGTGLDDGAVGYAMMFDILHAEEPLVLLSEAHRVLRRGGRLAIMHWNYDPTTPRGPSMDIRPRPEQCRAWAQAVGFRLTGPRRIDPPPYHYGMVMIRP